jgi:uncharacterized protein with GYD domain
MPSLEVVDPGISAGGIFVDLGAYAPISVANADPDRTLAAASVAIASDLDIRREWNEL